MRNAFHILVSLLMWCLFGYYWYVVAQRQINRASFQAVGVFALITLMGLLLTMWWIAHNKVLASRNRRRAAPEPLPEAFAADTLRRPLAGAALAEVKAARTVVVDLDAEGRKVYTVATGVGD